jgi:hypothetical protein
MICSSDLLSIISIPILLLETSSLIDLFAPQYILFITYVAGGGRGESIGGGREGNGGSSRKLHLDSVLGRRIVVERGEACLSTMTCLQEEIRKSNRRQTQNGAWKDPHSTWDCH